MRIPSIHRLTVPVVLVLSAFSQYTVAYERVTFYHNDALGSPVAATDINGELLWREIYSPFGSRLKHESRETVCSGNECAPSESSWDEKQWYTGKLEETRTGLQYFGARWYEPEIGRFLSVDPIEFRDNNLFSFNAYQYANNNPYTYVDPDGKDTISITGTIHVPGSILYAFGVSEVPVSGFSGGIAFSFPGFSGTPGEYDFGVVGGVDIPIVDAGLGKASVDFGYSKGSFDDLSGDSIEVSATGRGMNGGLILDAETGEFSGIKIGRGMSLGKLSQTLLKSTEKIKNRNFKSLVHGLITNNFSITFQRSQAKSISDQLQTGGDKKPNAKRDPTQD